MSVAPGWGSPSGAAGAAAHAGHCCERIEQLLCCRAGPASACSPQAFSSSRVGLGSLLDDRHGNLGAWFGGVAQPFAASVVATYFQAALVIGAHQRADGRQPTLGGVLAQAWALSGSDPGLGHAVGHRGLAVRAAEERLGISARYSDSSPAWPGAVASFLAVPVVVAEGLGRSPRSSARGTGTTHLG